MRPCSRLLPAAVLWIAAAAQAARHLPDPRIDDLIVEPVAGTPQVNVRAILSGSGRAAFHGTLELTLGEKNVRLPIVLEGGPAGAVGGLHFDQLMPLTGAKPWTPARPVLYQMQAALIHQGGIVDRRTVRFGVRTVALTDGWLALDGARQKVIALEFRPDWSRTLSARARETLAVRALERIREAGFTMILAEPDLLDDVSLDWCDRHGLLVTEGRRSAEAPGIAGAPDAFDAQDREVVSMIRAHRNHASLVLWRFAAPAGPEGEALRARIIAAAGLLDPSRPALGALPWPEITENTQSVPLPVLADLNLEKEFGSATAFDESRATVRRERLRHRIEALRMNPDDSGYVIPRSIPELEGVMVNRLLVLRPAPALLVGDAPLCATVTIVSSGTLPRALTLDWRLAAPGDDPAYPMPWRAGPPLTGATAVLWAPALPVRGRWQLQVRVRKGNRALASVEETVQVSAALESSQNSFALLGDAPGIREGFAAWIIPGAWAPQTVVVHPAQADAPAWAAVLDGVRAGRKAVVLELDDEDLAAIAAIPDLRMPLVLSASSTGSDDTVHYLRATRYGNGLPGVGRREPERWIAGALYAELLPVRSLVGDFPPPLAGAIPAAPTPDPGGGVPRRVADILELPLGKGRLVLCQYRLLEHLGEPLARAMFYRLLSL